MRVDGINGANGKTGAVNMPQANDSVSKRIQAQIANAQKELQELSSNNEMPVEEKLKRRQEIQKQIMDLNQQLRQHQIALRREQQAQSASMEDMLGGSRKAAAKAGNQGAGLSQASMKALISADSAMSQARVQGSVATRMEGRAGVLESEIKTDASRGGNVEAKQEELAETKQRAAAATASQVEIMAGANRELEAAAKADQQTEKTEKGEASKEKQDGNVTGTKAGEAAGEEGAAAAAEPVAVDAAETVDAAVTGNAAVTVDAAVNYKRVDIYI